MQKYGLKEQGQSPKLKKKKKKKERKILALVGKDSQIAVLTLFAAV